MADAFETLRSFEFGQPLWLLLLLGLIPLWRAPCAPGRAPAVTVSSLRLFRGLVQPVAAQWERRAQWLRLLAVVLIVCALARPRVARGVDEERTDGIDLLLVLDASRSMDTKDFEFEGHKATRREALLHVMDEFVRARPRDRIGVVGFAERPFLVSPLTLDHSWMLEAVSEIQLSLGTAIGSGVEAAVDLLRKAESGDKVAILVTDGLNTSGTKPLDAAQTARRFGVRLYTIGVVSYGGMATTEVDSLTLAQMARVTGGQFFQAADGASLQAIYRQIDQLERRPFRQPHLRAWRELFPWCVAVAGALVLIEVWVGHTRRLRLP